MAKKVYESTHSKNLDSFELLLSFVKELGVTYNPAKANLKLAALLLQFSGSSTIMNTFISKHNLYTVAVDNRQTAFQGIPKLSTRILNTVGSSDIDKKRFDDVKSINRSLQGVKAATASKVLAENATIDADTSTTPISAEEIKNSSSQKSYNMILVNFRRIVDFVNNETGYIPNEIDLKVVTLNGIISKMQTTNTALINAFTSLNTSRTNRNKSLYGETGICAIADEIKKYVKSVYGASSPEAKKICAVKFRKR